MSSKPSPNPLSSPPIKFEDITTESWRKYTFPGGHEVFLNQPVRLNVSKSGGHRVLTGDGVSHYIPSGWIHLEWVVNTGEPHFSF